MILKILLRGASEQVGRGEIEKNKSDKDQGGDDLKSKGSHPLAHEEEEESNSIISSLEDIKKSKEN